MKEKKKLMQLLAVHQGLQIRLMDVCGLFQMNSPTPFGRQNSGVQFAV